jgi:putative SOS response-associated peptidase YedK
VPADAFFEWEANGKTKQPYAIALRSRGPFAFAGLWENWKDPKTDEWLHTFTILTAQPNELVAPLHDRMPVKAARNTPAGLTIAKQAPKACSELRGRASLRHRTPATTLATSPN